jgi:hypothetical protein
MEDPMRRAAVVIPLAAAVLWFATPAQAFAPVDTTDLDSVRDGLILLVASAPVWTAFLWGDARRWWLIGLITVVQVPVTLIGFVPIVDPYVHLTLFALTLLVTGAALRVVRTRPVAAGRPYPPVRN